MPAIIYKNSRIYRKKPAFLFYDDPETTAFSPLFSYDCTRRFFASLRMTEREIRMTGSLPPEILASKQLIHSYLQKVIVQFPNDYFQ